jgi:tRNA-modifying protein YgfZ
MHMSDATQPFAARVDRDLVTVSGPDATSFLQSLLSQDLDAVDVGGTVRALLLQPQGKLLVDLYAVRREPNTWWCICEGGFGSVLAEGLGRFKIRVKVDIEQVDVAALAVRGAEVQAVDGAAVVPVDWDGSEAPASDVIGTTDAVNAVETTLGIPVVDEPTYERARIEAGVPRQGIDVDERTIPQEAGLERTAVSFTKGCFVGQELVCRIDTRGHVNRVLRRLRVDGDGTLAPADDVVADGKSVGSVTTSAGDVALGMLRREVEPGSAVQVGTSTAIVEPAWT